MGQNTQGNGNGNGNGQSWFKSQLTLTNLVVIGGFVFTIGTWQTRAEVTESRVKDFEATYMRRDVAEERFNEIKARLQRIEDELRMMRVAAARTSR